MPTVILKKTLFTNSKEKSNASFEKKSSSSNQGAMDMYRKTIPVQRFGRVSDIANAALFLASPTAAYTTGTDLLVDGGAYLTAPNAVFAHPGFVKMWS